MNRRILTVAICPLLLMATSGCQKTAPAVQPASAGGSMTSHSWAPTTNDANPLPGIHQAHLWCWWIAGEPALLIWADVEPGIGHSVATSHGGFEGRLNDVQIELHDNPTNPNSRTVSIAGTDYETANGSVFLISTQTETPTVKQLNRNLAELDLLKADRTGLDNTKLKALARTDADIFSFFGGPANKPDAP